MILDLVFGEETKVLVSTVTLLSTGRKSRMIVLRPSKATLLLEDEVSWLQRGNTSKLAFDISTNHQ